MIETAKPEDALQAAEWMVANMANNDVSTHCLERAVMAKVDDIMYVPLHKVLMLGSLAPNPESTGVQRLLALKRFLAVITAHYDDDIYYLTHGGTKLDEAAKTAGFEELPYKVYRLKHGKS